MNEDICLPFTLIVTPIDKEYNKNQPEILPEKKIEWMKNYSLKNNEENR